MDMGQMYIIEVVIYMLINMNIREIIVNNKCQKLFLLTLSFEGKFSFHHNISCFRIFHHNRLEGISWFHSFGHSKLGERKFLLLVCILYMAMVDLRQAAESRGTRNLVGFKNTILVLSIRYKSYRVYNLIRRNMSKSPISQGLQHCYLNLHDKNPGVFFSH